MSRRAMLLVGVAALLPSLAGPAQVGAAAPPRHQHFTPPREPLVLTRTLVRGLRDGHQIVVRRSYAVEFVTLDDGYRVNGQLLETTVEAPPRLAALAEIERKRPDEGTFPIELDRDGRIRSGPHRTPADSPVAEAALTRTRAMIATSGLAGADQREADRQLGQLAAAAGAGGQWPADLFTGASGERQERRAIALPDGEQGEVTVSIRAEGPIEGGLSSSMVRTVTTVMAGSTRVSSEAWNITRR
jgi:hypothetical protein